MMNCHSEPAVVIDDISAGVDWLTVTAFDQEMRGPLYYECQEIRKRNEAAGDNFKHWTFKGYSGYSCGGLRWGTRLDSDIAMLSGWDARQNWYIIGDWAQNCTRLDLAVTVELQKPVPDLVQTYATNLKRTNHRGVAYKGSVVLDSDGGQTLYVQRRTSNAFGRVYDKGLEAGLADQPGKLWRYEVQFNKRSAKPVFAQVLANRYVTVMTRWEDEVGASILATVYAWYVARNIPPLFNRNHHPALSLEVEAKITSDEISLAWLSSQVKPTVHRLAKHGKLWQVKQALGLTDEIQEHMERVVTD